jgi:hypothetical protein
MRRRGPDDSRSPRAGSRASGHIGRELGDIDADQLAGTLADRARDHHRVDIGALDRLHDGADGVGHREHADAIGANHDDVGLLAGCQRADLAFETGGAGAVDGRGLEHRFTEIGAGTFASPRKRR